MWRNINHRGHKMVICSLYRSRLHVWVHLMPCQCDLFFGLPCPAREDADHHVSYHDVWGKTWRTVSVNEQHLSMRTHFWRTIKCDADILIFTVSSGFYYSADLDVLPVGSSPGVQEITVYVILLMREVLLCWDADHPWAAIASHTQMQRVKTGPIIVLFSLKWTLRQTKGCALTCNAAVVII